MDTKYGYQIVSSDGRILKEAFNEFDSRPVAVRIARETLKVVKQRKRFFDASLELKTYRGGMVQYEEI